jgi:hypothetical protein
MNFASFLSPSDEVRARRTLEKLRRHEIAQWVLTGGMAIELHMLRFGIAVETRPLNDIDFLVDSFDEIPPTLSADFLLRHAHPHDPPAKTLLQCVDSETAVRVDVFRGYGGTTVRASHAELYGCSAKIVPIEDLTARAARLCMDLAFGEPMPAKHARDFLRLLPLVDTRAMEPVWREHRKAQYPESFAETARLLQGLIASRNELLIAPSYSRDVHARCARCVDSESFPQAEAGRVLELLGYC